ncbi:MAG: IPT/TIG domain-containing protein [Patescibacteria group bacterium]
MFKNKTKKLIIFLVVIGLFAVFSSVFAQSFGINEVGNGLNNSLTTSDPRATAGRIINIILGLLGVIAVGIIMWGGFVWLTSNGEEEKINSAKNILKNGVIGLIIILASWGIASFILSRLGGAINGGNNNSSCTSGEVQSCGCDGTMACSNGSWGFCVNSKCGSDNKPTSCDSSPNLGCQAANQICDPADYCDSTSCLCKPKGGPGDSCDANLQNQTCNPDNNLCGQYLSCNADTCTCFGPPVITEISPVGGFCQDNPDKSCTKDFDCGTTCNLTTPNGAVNNFITIYGKSFGAYSAQVSKVIFKGINNPREGKQPIELNPACINSWQDNEIVIAVPTGVSTGPIKVINKDNLSDETNNDYGPRINDFQANNIVRPGLCSLNPSQGSLSGKVDYQGFNLYFGNAYFGNYQSNVQGIVSNFSNPQGLSGNSLIPNIQPGTSGSFVISNINGNKQSSNSLTFIKEKEAGASPYIISFSPSEGTAGQYVTIRGKGFGPARGTSSVYFDNLEASYDFPDVCLNSVWKDDQIIVKVPASLPDAYHIIKIKLASTTIDTSKINPNTFRSDKNLSLLTSVCKIDPNNGPVATPVSLWGENFGSVNSEALIKFSSDKTATGTIIKEGRADLVKTNVPSGAITGPVKVIKKDQFGNEVNFTVGSCTVNADCGAAQVCCPAGTYRQGRCFGSLESCSSDMPTSVFEWGFSTSFNNILTDPYYSCAGMANKLGACQVGTTCPNTPGTCSPYAGGNKIIGKDCDFSCASVPGCSILGVNNCSYDSVSNKCISNGATGVCDLNQKFVYSLGGTDKEFTKTCNKDKHWEIITPGSCPANWTRATGNRCVDLNSNCSACATGLNCEAQNNGGNRCVSELICPSGSTCEKNSDSSGAGKCVSKDEATCGCCCTIGKSATDCCAGLTCAGTCGSDTVDDGVGLGKCGGCAAAGSTTAARDAACNCTGHSGQYCDINSAHPQGVCSDCTGLSNKQNCDDHSAACCFDAKKTINVLDDYCRGGEAIKSGADQGYCAYYDCQKAGVGDPKLCAVTTPVKLGFFNTIDKCTSTSTGCFVNSGADHCSLFDGDQGACLAETNCCFNKSDSKCKGSEKISSGPDKGYCAYYNCQSGNNKLCNLIATTSGQFMSTSICATKCANEEGGAGLACAGIKPDAACIFSGCTLPGLKCLTATGGLGLLPDCGTCCCTPGLATDSCATTLTPTLHCQADKGNCSGAGRGLCCGCAADSECGYPETTGCAADSCCQARPKIESITPPHLSSSVCRNAVVSVAFDQLMNVSSSNNLVLLEEKSSGVCQSGYLAGSGNSVQDLFKTNITTRIAQAYNNLSLAIRKIISRFNGQALADVPDSNKVYCFVPGNVRNEENIKKSTLIFSPNKLLNPNTNYYLVVLGDENLNSQSGVISLNGIGFNGEGYFDPSRNIYVEGDSIKFNNKVYKNSRITKFTTLSGEGSICKIDHVLVTPGSYLFKTTTNDLNERDNDARDKSFDSVADRDKVFTAKAYSDKGQALQPVTNYFWDWNWKAENPSVAAISPVVNLEANRAFVSAQAGIVDDSTKLTATINMSRFQISCNSSMSCECKDAGCASTCCNNY